MVTTTTELNCRRGRRRGVMNHLFFSLCLLVISISPSLAFDITASVDIHTDEQGRNFILIDEGDNLELNCENFQGDHHWVLPDNSDVKGFTKEDQAERVKTFAGHDSAVQSLTITGAKVTDTGMYGCKYEYNVEEDVYIFVKGPHFFLKTEHSGFQANETFTIPCRSTWPPLDEEGIVELYAEGDELMKEASKHYDPRVGFHMTPKTMGKLKLDSAIRFECRYNTDSVHYLVSKASEIKIDTFDLLFENITEFPHIGGTLNFTCTISGRNAHENIHMQKLEPSCPRCDLPGKPAEKDMYMQWYSSDPHFLKRVISIWNLTSQDAGLYTCKWLTEKGSEFVFMKEVKKQIPISTTMEQIKLLNRTQAIMEITEGAELTISATFRTYPEDRTIYSSKWKRLFTRAQKGTNESEILINDDLKTINSNLQGKDVLETLVVTKTTLDMSGVYALEVAVHNVTRRVEWQVRVKAKKIVPHIEIASQDKWILFDQNYYKAGSPLRVICFVESYPKPEVHLMMRKLDPLTDWEGVDGAVAIEGTYSKGYTLNVTANDDVEYKCEGRRKNEKPVSESKQVRVSDSATEVNVAWHKPDKDSSANENKDQIYEGDKIELECIVPKSDQVTMAWQFEKAPANMPETTTVAAHSKHLVATIEAASAAHSGDYTCVVRDEHNKTVDITRKIEVTKTTKPFLRGASIEPNIVLKYEEPQDLDCPMDGTPDPQYTWLKDGYPFTDKSLLARNGQTLHIPRAALQDEGIYTCKAGNRAGETALEYKIKVKGAPRTLSAVTIFLIVLAFLVLIGCLIAAFILYRKRSKQLKQQNKTLEVLYEQLMRADPDAPVLPHGKVTMDQRVRQTAYNSKYEIDMRNLVLEGTLGAGQFGTVRRGRLSRGAPVSDTAAYRGPALTVAVKLPRNGSNPEDQKALIDELKILIAIDNLEEVKHPNVLSLVGAVTKNMKDGQFFVVTEMCENGDLKTFLQRYKGELKDKFLNELKESKQPATSNDDYLVPNNQVTVQYMNQNDPEWHRDQERDRLLDDPHTLSTSDLISFSMQIASGMDFLSGVSCIHRDLAARNCLLNANKVVKIADFGMAKNEDKGYYRMQKTNVMVPYRWMAIESMEDHTFTVESDIWSYGIVLYEIFTLGSQPYPGVPNNNLHEHLKSGQRNPRPELCHPDIYNLMLQTWDKDAELRPSFGQCSTFMRNQLQLLNPEILEATDKELDRNSAQIAQFDQFRGPRAVANLNDQEVAALYAGQRTPVHNGNGGAHNEDEGERIYIKELRR